MTVKLPSSKLRQATSSKQGSSISVNNDSTPKRSTRGGKKSYVVESESDEEEDEEEGEDEIQVGAPAAVADDDDEDEEMNDVDEDAEGEEIEEEMDLDAEGEEDEDAEGEEDVDMSTPAPAPIIKIQKPSKRSPESKKTKDATPKKASAQASALNDSDDDELSELESDEELEGEEDAEGEEDDEDMDAEGEEIEEDQDAEGEPEPSAEPGQEVEEMDSDDESAAPNKTRMTVRQRARFEDLDESHYQALSNGTCSFQGIGSALLITVHLQRFKQRRSSRWRKRPCGGPRWHEGGAILARSAMKKSRYADPEQLTQLQEDQLIQYSSIARNNQQAPQEASQQDQP